MRLSTSSNIHQVFRDDNYFFDARDSIERCHAAGYRAIDVSFNSVSTGDRPMAGPGWRDWIAAVRAQLRKHEMPATQAHAFFYGGRGALSAEEIARREGLIRRSIEAASLLGVPWIVVHPVHGKDAQGLAREQVRRMNVEYLRPYAAFAAECGIGIAIENMFSGNFHTADELLELIDDLESPAAGICWDTGHANLTQQDQPAAILRMGRRLKALHINDNRGKQDDHMVPYLGDIRWPEIVAALRESGYEGDFTYEIQNTTKNVPLSLRDQLLRYTWEVGQELLNGNA